MLLLLVFCCLAAASGGALPQLFPPSLVQYPPSAVYQYRYTAPSTVYQYRYTAPQLTNEEEDRHAALVGVRGSYSVRYPAAGGLLTQTYIIPSRPLVLLRTTEDGPAGPAGTLVTLRNSKDSAYLLEMQAQSLDERSPPVFTRTEAVLVEAAPVFTNSKVADVLLELRLESEASGDTRQQELQLRDPGDAVVVEAAAADPADGPADDPSSVFVNSKESEVLRVLRRQSLRDGLTARQPPIVGPEEIIVEAEVLPREA